MNISKLEQLNCPNCKNEVDRRSVIQQIRQAMNPDLYPFHDRNEPVIVSENMVYCCEQCVLDHIEVKQ